MTDLLLKKYRDQLVRWIGKPCRLKLLYKISRDGCSAESFHKQCDHKGATVTVLYNNHKTIYGGYLSQSWNSDRNWIHDPKAFLFRLQFNGSSNPMHFPVTDTSSAGYGHHLYGPTFGGGHDILTFTGRINKSETGFPLNGYSNNIGDSYDLKRQNKMTITNCSLLVKDMEVYSVIDEIDSDSSSSESDVITECETAQNQQSHHDSSENRPINRNLGKRGRPFESKKRRGADVLEESSEDEIPSPIKRKTAQNQQSHHDSSENRSINRNLGKEGRPFESKKRRGADVLEESSEDEIPSPIKRNEIDSDSSSSESDVITECETAQNQQSHHDSSENRPINRNLGKEGRPFESKKRRGADVLEESSEDEIPSPIKRNKIDSDSSSSESDVITECETAQNQQPHHVSSENIPINRNLGNGGQPFESKKRRGVDVLVKSAEDEIPSTIKRKPAQTQESHHDSSENRPINRNLGEKGRPFESKKRRGVDVLEESSENEIPSTVKRNSSKRSQSSPGTPRSPYNLRPRAPRQLKNPALKKKLN